MTKSSLKVRCNCGNKSSFLFTVRGGMDDSGLTGKFKAKPNSYWIVCADCDSAVELIGAVQP